MAIIRIHVEGETFTANLDLERLAKGLVNAAGARIATRKLGCDPGGEIEADEVHKLGALMIQAREHERIMANQAAG